MKRAALVDEALRVLATAVAIDNTSPNYPCAGGMVDDLFINAAQLGGGMEWWQWSPEALAALLTALLEHAPADDAWGLVARLRHQAKWYERYRAELDVRARSPKLSDEVVERRVSDMTRIERRIATGRQIVREHGQGATIAAKVLRRPTPGRTSTDDLAELRAAKRRPPKSAPVTGSKVSNVQKAVAS